MHHLPLQYWALLVIGALLLITFYACLWIAGRESEQESRFEAQWDLEHEAADVSENAEDVYPMEATFHARPSF
ncbi:MAG TPA: hypothetical protein VMT20_03220 [Terriglobia bacterium]|nr:hypothetical protein [Terriglobia bacterium]